MYRSFVVFGLYLSFAIAVGAACGPAPLETPSDDDDDSAPRGGTNGSGGSSSGGTGNLATGGTGNFGTGGTGNVATGGTGNVGTGGTATGGTANAGRAAGGASAAAGRAAGGTAGMPTATGGSVGTTGGTTGTTGGTGGTVGTAGTGTTGGSAGTGASTVSCDTAFAVSNDGFVRAPMKGGACWHGYASAGADADSTGMPTSFAMCGAGCMLHVAGTLAAADASYAYLGFNVNQANGASTFTTIKPTGTGVKATFTQAKASDVRVQISAGSTRWCAKATSGTSITWTTFNTECWEGGKGTAYNMEAIDQIQLSIPGKAAETTAYDVTLVSIEET